MGVILKDRKVQWVYRLGDEEPTHLSVDEEIGEQFAAVSINRYGREEVGEKNVCERERENILIQYFVV